MNLIDQWKLLKDDSLTPTQRLDIQRKSIFEELKPIEDKEENRIIVEGYINGRKN